MIRDLVEKFGLTPHPEGGYYRETYRSSESYRTARGERSACTAILFLLDSVKNSSWHRIQSDEIWYFHRGDPLEILEIGPSGPLKSVLSPDCPQHIVEGGHWFGAKTLGEYSLIGCSVSPGFEFGDFELAGDLAAMYPRYRKHIEQL